MLDQPVPDFGREFFDNCLDGIYIADAEGNLLAANVAYASLLGYSVAEMLGHSVMEFVAPADFEHAQAILAHILKEGLHRPFEEDVRIVVEL